MPIDRITIQGVRGIGHPVTLHLNGKSLLLHGDNGTGKSSVERALRWALAGDEEPTSEDAFTSESSCRRHVNVDADYPCVSVKFDDGSRIEVTPGGCRTEHEGESFRDACRRGLPFLRRSELLNVVSSRPSDRFRYFESFLGLGHTDSLSGELTETKTELEQQAKKLALEIEVQIKALRSSLPQERQGRVVDARTFEEQFVQLVVEDLRLAQPGVSWEAARASVERAPGTPEEQVELRAQLSNLEQDWAGLRSELDQQASYPEELEARRREAEADSLDAVHFDLIRHALEHFRTGEGDSCPVCGQSVEWEKTRKELEKRNRRLTEYGQLVQQKSEAVRTWGGRWAQFCRLRDRTEELLSQEWGDLELAPAPAALDLLSPDLGAGADQEAALLAVGGEALRKYLSDATGKANHLVAEKLGGLAAVGQLTGLALAASLLESYDECRPRLMVLEAESRSIRGEIEMIGTILKSIRKARQDVARETLDRIGERVSHYYFKIHPPENREEATGSPSIDVQGHGAGTAYVRGQFDQKSVKDPQWVYSDGHLDTVGICIFLALRRYRGDRQGDPRLLVLDDIIISIDLGHARRLIELLRDEFGDHQILLLTHNGLFAHWCSSMLPGMRRLEIKSWSLEEGPRIGAYVESRDRLLKSFEESSTKVIGMNLMALMDEWLAEARYAYSVSVPAKYGEEYTLTEIFEPFAKAVRTLGRSLSSDLGGAVELVAKLADLPAIRNALPAHDNDFAKEFPREVIIKVSQTAVALVDALYCPECRSFARPIPNRRSPSILHCQCRRIQHVPPGGGRGRMA